MTPNCTIQPTKDSAQIFFVAWSRAGIFIEQAYSTYCFRLENSKRARRRKYVSIDSTYVKNQFGIYGFGRNPTDRGRKATKVSALVDERGTLLALSCHCANIHDTQTVKDTIGSTLLPIGRLPIYGDKGYVSDAHRKYVVSHGLIP